MKISLNWIGDFVDLTGADIKSLINDFTLSVAEVEGVEYKGKDLSGVVVAKIVEVEKHPNSTKLHLLKVDYGSTIVDVVCGAPNVRVGLVTAFAKVGANVNGMSINVAEIAGYTSSGMCCSEKELGISDYNGGIIELDEIYDLGSDIKSVFEIDDAIVEVDNKSLTHRPDLWGHYGIAREIAALLNKPLKPLDLYNYNPDGLADSLEINIEDTDKCFRYTAARIGGITRKISPVNMRLRLFYCDLRAINYLADLTNYIMLELGQPMHAFDSEKIENICVKTFSEPIKFTTLDNIERTIDTDTLMICNGTQPVAIAGIMGGANSEITDTTTSVMIESANFNGITTRKSSTNLNLRTAASARYEKVLDPELTKTALLRFVFLLTKYDSGAKFITQIKDKYTFKFEKIILNIDKTYVEKYIGIAIETTKIIKILQSLEFIVKQNNDDLIVEVPSFRATKDVTIKADLVEEIARIYGYNNILVKPSINEVTVVRPNYERELQYKVKCILSYSFALSEVHSYIWYDNKVNKELGIEIKENVSILNAQTPEFNNIRYSMVPSMLNIVNANKLNQNDIGIYEIGRVASGLDTDNKCIEQRYLTIALASKVTSERDLYYKMLNIANSVTENAKNCKATFAYSNINEMHNWVNAKNNVNILCNNTDIGYITVLHPLIKNNIDKKMNIVLCEINFDKLADINVAPKNYNAITKYPSIEVDYTFIVDNNVLYGDIVSIIEEESFEYLKSINYVGIYVDKNNSDKQSITIKLIYQSLSKTLSSSDISEFTTYIIEKLAVNNIILKQ